MVPSRLPAARRGLLISASSRRILDDTGTVSSSRFDRAVDLGVAQRSFLSVFGLKLRLVCYSPI